MRPSFHPCFLVNTVNAPSQLVTRLLQRSPTDLVPTLPESVTAEVMSDNNAYVFITAHHLPFHERSGSPHKLKQPTFMTGRLFCYSHVCRFMHGPNPNPILSYYFISIFCFYYCINSPCSAFVMYPT